MSIAEHFTTKQAAELTGASRQIIRTYTNTYQRYFSTEGAPEQPGQPRRFTADDLKLIRYVYTSTAEQKLTHEQVLERLAAGELDRFDWQPLESPGSGESRDMGAEQSANALVPIERLQAAQALIQEAQRREAEAAQKAQELQDRLLAAERDLGKAQGELAAYKAMQRKPPPWWAWLFGSRQGE